MNRLTNFAIVSLAAASLAWGRSGGPGAGYSGAPGDSLCIACHGGPENTGGGSVAISFGGATSYTPGQIMHVSVTISDPAQKRWGFEVSPRLVSDVRNMGAGTLAPTDANTQLTTPSGTIQWIEHTSAGTRNGTSSPVTFNFDWTPPATNQGDVIFYVAANAANGNGAPTGDHIYTTTATLTAAAGGALPAIAQNGVSNAADGSAHIAPGGWFSVFGSNFGTTTRLWTAADIVDGKLPTSLDGVEVTMNGKPAAVYYISPTQINAQAPDDTTRGLVNVVVKTPAGTSQASTVNLDERAPSLFTFSPQNARYAAAVAADGTTLGPPGLFGTALTTRPAAAGETILLFGNAFGATNPAEPTGRVFSGTAPLIDDAKVTIGGVNAQVLFAGLSATSLYQFNIVVPAGLPAGDQKVVITIGGRQTQDNLFLSVQQ